MIVVDLIAVLFIASTGECTIEQDLDSLLVTNLKHLQLEVIWFMMEESQAIVDNSKGGLSHYSNAVIFNHVLWCMYLPCMCKFK